ncbi:hypothetical protein CLF_104624 [Clonorchis sinensis]|uniref:Uncharacterized protein n=1 Tax=Clonorchis sinensis TaxID=79923 RepID=G7YNX8_CLOSI|nr:hypothetical protein CLF_104624 [Clonorchis sinensis]
MACNESRLCRGIKTIHFRVIDGILFNGYVLTDYHYRPLRNVRYEKNVLKETHLNAAESRIDDGPIQLSVLHKNHFMFRLKRETVANRGIMLDGYPFCNQVHNDQKQNCSLRVVVWEGTRLSTSQSLPLSTGLGNTALRGKRSSGLPEMYSHHEKSNANPIFTRQLYQQPPPTRSFIPHLHKLSMNETVTTTTIVEKNFVRFKLLMIPRKDETRFFVTDGYHSHDELSGELPYTSKLRWLEVFINDYVGRVHGMWDCVRVKESEQRRASKGVCENSVSPVISDDICTRNAYKQILSNGNFVLQVKSFYAEKPRGTVREALSVQCHPIVHTGRDALPQIADNFTTIHITEMALTVTQNWLNMRPWKRRKPASRMLLNPHVDVVIPLKEITDREKIIG